MTTLSRALRQWDPARIAAVSLGLAAVVLVAAYGVAAMTTATAATAAAAAAFLGIVGTGLLYAWRPWTGGFD
ncbi:MAG: hypothetical protein ABI334_01965 [Candidatus Dormiibacterota bacterium]